MQSPNSVVTVVTMVTFPPLLMRGMWWIMLSMRSKKTWFLILGVLGACVSFAQLRSDRWADGRCVDKREWW